MDRKIAVVPSTAERVALWPSIFILALSALLCPAYQVHGTLIPAPIPGAHGPSAAYLAPDACHILAVWQALDASNILVCSDSLGALGWKKALGFGAIHVRFSGTTALVVRHSNEDGLQIQFVSWRTGFVRRELSYKLPAPVDAVAIVDTSTLLVFRMQGDTATAIQTLRMSRETLVLLDTVTTPGICVGRRYFRVTAQGYSGVGNIGPTEDALLHIARRGVRVESLAGLRRLDEFYGGSLSCGDTIYVWATRPTNQAERRGVTVKGAAYTLQGLGPARVVGEFARMNTLWDITDSWMLLGTLGTRKFTIVRKLPPPAGHGNSALTHEGRQ